MRLIAGLPLQGAFAELIDWRSAASSSDSVSRSRSASRPTPTTAPGARRRSSWSRPGRRRPHSRAPRRPPTVLAGAALAEAAGRRARLRGPSQGGGRCGGAGNRRPRGHARRARSRRRSSALGPATVGMLALRRLAQPRRATRRGSSPAGDRASTRCTSSAPTTARGSSSRAARSSTRRRTRLRTASCASFARARFRFARSATRAHRASSRTRSGDGYRVALAI